jgi:hypothetical protein
VGIAEEVRVGDAVEVGVAEWVDVAVAVAVDVDVAVAVEETAVVAVALATAGTVGRLVGVCVGIAVAEGRSARGTGVGLGAQPIRIFAQMTSSKPTANLCLSVVHCC